MPGITFTVELLPEVHTCACGLRNDRIPIPCGYCEANRISVKGPAQEPTRESLMAEADARLDAARTRGRETMDALLPHPPVKAKRSRRSKAEMAAHRAEVASRGQDAVPAWLRDADAEADAEFQRVTGDV